jgi:serine/threonine-protein kinase
MATSASNSTDKDGVSSPPPAHSVQGGEKDPGEDLPRILGRYVLLKRIARGGMGEVFLGSTMGLEGAERPVVVKIIRREHAKDPSFIARFLDEARVQAQLHHSGVAQVLEAATCAATGEPYAVVEHVEGKSLGDVRARALQIGYRVGWSEAVAVATMIAEALAHVHERQDASGRALAIVHRDLSPQNVMLSFAGDVKIIDFGTARGQNRRCRTVSGVVFAKPGYVAPEVANGDSGDARVDVYALGVMLWELCAGRRFLQGDAGAHMASVARNQSRPPPIAASCGAPPELDAIIEKLTAFDRESRYAESRVAACDLAKLLASAQALPTGERGVRPRAARLMQSLFPSEPSRSRREFAKLIAAAQANMKLALAQAAAPLTSGRGAAGGVSDDIARASRLAANTPPERRSEPHPPAPDARSAGPRSSAAPSEPGLLAGTRYRLGPELGRGASSVVYEAAHVDLGRRVAIKVLDATHAGVKEFAARFRREARAMSLLSHESLVKIIDFGEAADGRLYCVMELLDGETLEQRLTRERRIAWPEALEIAAKALRALEVAHGARIVHRDIKPSNLFLMKSGGLKLLDFGLAKAMPAAPDAVASAGAGAGTDALKSEDADADKGADGDADKGAEAQAGGHTEEAQLASDEVTRRAGLTILGTPEYMAPEQASSGQGDARSDVYALGCVMYEMITGGLPFSGAGTIAVLAAKIKGSPERISERCPALELPRMVDDLVMRALARHPSVRFQSAAEMRKAVEVAIEAPLARRASRRVAGLSAFAAVMAFALVLVAGRAKEIQGVVAGFRGGREQAPAALTAPAQPDPAAAPASGDGALDLAALVPGVKPIEADPVMIGPEPSEGEQETASADSAGSAPAEEGEPALEGEAGDDDSAPGAANAAMTKPAAHEVRRFAPKTTRARQHSKTASSSKGSSDDDSKTEEGKKASEASKDSSASPAGGGSAAPSKHAAASGEGGKAAPSKADKPGDEGASSSKSAANHASGNSKGEASGENTKAAGEKTQTKASPPSKTTRKDGTTRRKKKKSRLAQKAE